MIKRIASALRRLADRQMSRCRVCGSSKDVVSYDPRGIWAFFGRRTWCPSHCPDHYQSLHRDGRYCDNCGLEPDDQWYADQAEHMAELEARG
jgi:hypothetical protein